MSVTIDKTFEAAVNNLQAYAGKSAAGMKLGRLPWSGLGKDGGVPDGFDHDELASAFDRSGTAKIYADATTAVGVSYRNAQIAKIQGDVLSAFERDTRMRHRSRVRMLSHTLSRQVTHGLAVGPIQGSFMQFVKLLIDSGAR